MAETITKKESDSSKSKKSGLNLRDFTLIAMFTAIIAICAWITIPTTVPFTLQTFAIFLTIGLLGGKRGTISVILYILLGAIGVPVFSGFKGGIGVLLGQTGGYIVGFIGTALFAWLVERLLGRKQWVLLLSMVIGLLICYAVGTLWFIAVYTNSTGAVGLLTVLGWCVFPFIIPDAVKISVALIITGRLRKYIK